MLTWSENMMCRRHAANFATYVIKWAWSPTVVLNSRVNAHINLTYNREQLSYRMNGVSDRLKTEPG